MASSFADQIPVVIHLLQKLGPSTLLDIGKGFGKYGFLAHEYAGIAPSHKADPTKTLAQQSRLQIDAVEVERDFLWPHLSHLYRNVIVGKIEDIYVSLPHYDVVLMADVIEHIEKPAAKAIVKHLVDNGSIVIVATPKLFFQQHLYESGYEEHVSHWLPHDFSMVPFVDFQNTGAGRIYVLSRNPIEIRGFGNRLRTRLRRLARIIRDEFV